MRAIDELQASHREVVEMQESRSVTAHVGDGNEPRYWPISRYGVIGDCRTAALIAPNGSVDWCCLPHFDRPAIFLRLLDADKGGYFRVSPAGPADSSMSYLPGTNRSEEHTSELQSPVHL